MSDPLTTQPLYVGRYRNQGRSEFLPVSQRDYQRDVAAWLPLVDALGLKESDQVLVISLGDEIGQFSAFEQALWQRRLIRIGGEATASDARRTETHLRRFDIKVVVGLNGDVLDGLEAMGKDPAALFVGRTVFARPCAYDRLVGVAGVKLLRWLELGPVVAMECPRGDGAHVDDEEWRVEVEDGELLVSSRMPRLLPFHRHRTGVAGRILEGVCRCGSSGTRIAFSPGPANP